MQRGFTWLTQSFLAHVLGAAPSRWKNRAKSVLACRFESKARTCATPVSFPQPNSPSPLPLARPFLASRAAHAVFPPSRNEFRVIPKTASLWARSVAANGTSRRRLRHPAFVSIASCVSSGAFFCRIVAAPPSGFCLNRICSVRHSFGSFRSIQRSTSCRTAYFLSCCAICHSDRHLMRQIQVSTSPCHLSPIQKPATIASTQHRRPRSPHSVGWVCNPTPKRRSVFAELK